MTEKVVQAQPALEMLAITKRFPGVLALDEVNFSVHSGEIHALLGQNGAGKSTLMKILVGDYSQNEGEIWINGKRVALRHPSQARALGIAIVYQELSLLPNLTVAENIFLGHEPERHFLIDDEAMRREARQILTQLSIDHLGVDRKLDTLPLAQQQLIEIAKALSFRPRILILDEPTAALSPEDAERLFRILKRLKAQGIAIVYISHRLKEIITHCDRGTVLRNGRVVGTLDITPGSGKETEDALIELMIGQQIDDFYRDRQATTETAASETLLEVERMTLGTKLRDVSFVLRRGEIVGITGLLGAGQNELARALFGIQQEAEGIIRRNGKVVEVTSPRKAIEMGICLLTENRKEEGLFLDMSAKENITMPSLEKFIYGPALPVLRNRQERAAAERFIDKVDIVLRSAAAKVRTLSGGNQQKAIIARWLLRDLEVLIFIEPTRGIDIGAKAEIYRHLDALAQEGRGIIVVSPELLEVLGIADRILVMHEGSFVREFSAADAREEALLAAIQGAAAASQTNMVSDGSDITERTSVTRTIL